jgi:hypothetical protein
VTTTEGGELGRLEFRTGGSASIRVDAPAEVVYDRVADVTRTGEQSLECRSAEWLPGATPGAVGSRFRGRNKSGLARWSRVCEVVEADRGRRFAFRTVPERWDFMRKDSTIWGYTVTPDGDGVVLTHDYQVVKMAVPVYRGLLALVFPHHRDMRPHLEHTVHALKTEIEASVSTGAATSSVPTTKTATR